VVRLKLAFLAPEFLPTRGGVGVYSVELIRNLSKNKDMEIHVITPRRGINYDASKVLEYFNNNITMHNISNANEGFFYNFKFQFSVLKNFERLNQKHKFDLIHSANLVHMPDIYLKFKKQNCPSMITVHSTLQSQSHVHGKQKFEKHFGRKTRVENLTSLFYPYIHIMEKTYLKKTDNIITVSDWIKNFVDEDKNKNIEVIHNGVDTKKFSKKNKNSAKNEFDFLDEINKPIVLYCGRLLALKGLKILIDSIKDILKQEDAYFVFAGKGEIKEWEKELKLNNISKENYIFLDYVDYERIHYLYSKADIFVLPSFTESCPITILEAMSTGLPVVASDVGGVSEILSNNKDGILVEPGSKEQLAETINSLIKNKNLRNKIAKNAREKVENEFDSKIMAQKTKKFYDKILEGDKK
jgi:glycosyltransferase involved in cell wall biosynthesis